MEGSDIRTCWVGMEGWALVDQAEYKSLKKQIAFLQKEVLRLEKDNEILADRGVAKVPWSNEAW